MMTGKCPYEGMKQVEVALAVINHNHRPTLPSNCTFEQRSFIQVCILAPHHFSSPSLIASLQILFLEMLVHKAGRTTNS